MEQIGRYLVRGEIGKGGFGIVYRAWDPVVRRDVAIKVLTSVNDPGRLARFRSEPETTGILKHKNIITLYDFGEHDAVPYLVMELLEGRTLREAIETGACLSLFEKVAILEGIARGLLHAHQNGVIHRDVKPANIMLLADGSVKILDFGIARMVNPDLTRQTSTGMIVGTAAYMAPEQFEGEDATELSDIFSYGVVCYELLSGKQPFHASNPMAIINLISTKVPEPLRTFVPDCPEALDSIVQMAMAKRTSERYQSLQDLLFDLAPIEAGLRKNWVDGMASEAQRSLETGDFDSAQQSVWRALALDPNHRASQELRRRIQRQRERLALEQRFQEAVEGVESLLRRESFDEAIRAMETMRGWLSSDSAVDLRADLESRLSAARERFEKSQRIEALLAEAHDAAGRHDLGAASQSVALVLSIDSGNTAALVLEAWVAAETARARVEAEKAERARQRQEELLMVRQGVEGHIAALRFDDASRLIEKALQRYPGDLDLLAMQSLVDTASEATRQQAAEALRAEEERQAQQAQASNSAPPPEILPAPAKTGTPEPQLGGPILLATPEIAPEGLGPKVPEWDIREQFEKWRKAWERIVPAGGFVRRDPATVNQDVAVPEAPAGPPLISYARWAPFRLPLSRRQALVAVVCGVVLVTAMTAIAWMLAVTVEEVRKNVPKGSPSAQPAEALPAKEPSADKPPANKPPAKASSPEAPPGSYWQVLATPNRRSAESTLRSLLAKRFPASLSAGPNNLTRVLVGPYRDAASLGRAKSDLEAAGFRAVRR